MPSLPHRPLTLKDSAAVLALANREEVFWFDKPETDAGELAEDLALISSLPDDTLLVGAPEPVAAAWVWLEGGARVLSDPTVPAEVRVAAYEQVLPWLAAKGAREVEALARDSVMRATLQALGWKPWVSAFELTRPLGLPENPLPPPSWPSGVTVVPFDLDRHAPAVHSLVYERAGWTDVAGHSFRPYEQWRSLLVHERFDPGQQVLAQRNGELVGCALGRSYSDGTGWVWQLAVTRAEQGRGLGRALLLEVLARHEAAGAPLGGLSVFAGNERALGLYRAVGLSVEREWVHHRPPPPVTAATTGPPASS